MAGPSFIAPTTPFDKRQLGKYEVLCRLTTGGMSEIFLAHQSGLAGFRKLVVLKTILPDIGGEDDFVRMFLEEARTTAAFTHPNVAQVFELDVGEGQLFMAMEFVQGCTLVEMARACRQAKESIPIGFTLQAVRDTALALHYAHTFTDARGRRQVVIHRDVAEKNIMVTYEGVTKLLDFGIAKALGSSGRTTVGMVKGTSGYMSPEQIRGEPLDPRSDIFALGVVMHECLTGLRLFHGKSAEEGMLAALRQDVVPPSKYNPAISAHLDAVVLKSLERDRELRFSTALEFARAIERAAPGLIWHPEQSGELVQRHFLDRRAETRALLEAAAAGKESTGEIRIDSVMAKVKASAESPKDTAKETTDPSRPVAPPLRGAELSATLPPAKPPVPATPPIPAPKFDLKTPSKAPPNPVVPPPKPASVVPPPVAAKKPAEISVNLNPPESIFDATDEDAEAKTMPASSLGEDLKAMRANFTPERQPEPPAAFRARTTGNAEAHPKTPAPPAAPSVIVPAPDAVVTGESAAVVPDAPKAPEPPPVNAFEDPDAKTSLVSPDAIKQLRSSRLGSDAASKPEARKERPKKSLVPVIVASVVVLIALLFGLLYALHLPPFSDATEDEYEDDPASG